MSIYNVGSSNELEPGLGVDRVQQLLPQLILVLVVGQTQQVHACVGCRQEPRLL